MLITSFSVLSSNLVHFFLGDTLDEHVNTLLSLGINRRHTLPRVSNNCPVISLLDTPEVNKVRTLTCT
jgi:hypothetical protein